MIRVQGQRLIKASVQKVFQLISRLETHPRVTGLWMTADLLERRANGVTVQYRGYLAGIPVESIQQATLQPPHRIEFRQTRGGLKMYRGAYVLKPVEGETELALTLEVDVGMPLITDAAAYRVFDAYVDHSLEKFKLTAERELPRPIRRPQPPAAGPLAAVTPPPVTPPTPPESPSPPSPQVAEAPMVAQATQGRKRRRRRRRRRRSPGETPPATSPVAPTSGGSPA